MMVFVGFDYRAMWKGDFKWSPFHTVFKCEMCEMAFFDDHKEKQELYYVNSFYIVLAGI